MVTFRDARVIRGWGEDVGVLGRTLGARAPRNRCPFVRQLHRFLAFRTALLSLLPLGKNLFGEGKGSESLPASLNNPPHPSSPNLIARILSVTESRAELEKGRRACSCLLGLRGQSSRPSRPHTQPRAHHMPFLGLLRHRKFPAHAQHSTTPRECSGALTSARSLDPRCP